MLQHVPISIFAPARRGPDSAGTENREHFERDGRSQASFGSTGSGGLGQGFGGDRGGSSGGGGPLRRDSIGRARAGTGLSEAGISVSRSGVRVRTVEVEFNPFKKQDEKEVCRAYFSLVPTLEAPCLSSDWSSVGVGTKRNHVILRRMTKRPACFLHCCVSIPLP